MGEECQPWAGNDESSVPCLGHLGQEQLGWAGLGQGQDQGQGQAAQGPEGHGGCSSTRSCV